jgi:hypothetical protein
MHAPTKTRRLERFASYLDAGLTWQERVLWIVNTVMGITGTSLIAFFGINGDLPIVWLGLIWFADIALLSIACTLAKTVRHRLVLTGCVLTVTLLVTGIVFRQQHNREERERVEAQKIADNYIIEYDQPTFKPEIIPGKRGPNGGPMMGAITVGLVFNNPNDFDVWIKSFRRHVQIADHTSGSEDQTIYTKIPRDAQGATVSDLRIEFPKPVEFSPATAGVMDFEMCFGKQRNQMNKGFWLKIKMNFSNYSGFSTGEPPEQVPVSLENGPYGYLDSCRG